MTHMPGNHGLLDLYGCDEAILKDEGRLKTALAAAAQAAEATILTEHFHTFGRRRRRNRRFTARRVPYQYPYLAGTPFCCYRRIYLRRYEIGKSEGNLVQGVGG